MTRSGALNKPRMSCDCARGGLIAVVPATTSKARRDSSQIRRIARSTNPSEVTVPSGKGSLRLDAWDSSELGRNLVNLTMDLLSCLLEFSAALAERLTMSRGKIALIALLALSATPVLAQNSQPAPKQLRGSNDEQNACQRDAVRFCREAVPDTFRVLACLQTNRQKISKGCQQVLANHGQ